MDKKTLIGLLIVGLILFGYVFYNSKQAAKYQQELLRADSIARIEHPERYIEEVPLSDTGKEVRDALLAREAEQAKQDSLLIANIGTSLVDASRAEARTYTLENDLIKVWISSKGATVANVELKNYKRYDGQQIGRAHV